MTRTKKHKRSEEKDIKPLDADEDDVAGEEPKRKKQKTTSAKTVPPEEKKEKVVRFKFVYKCQSQNVEFLLSEEASISLRSLPYFEAIVKKNAFSEGERHHFISLELPKVILHVEPGMLKLLVDLLLPTTAEHPKPSTMVPFEVYNASMMYVMHRWLNYFSVWTEELDTQLLVKLEAAQQLKPLTPYQFIWYLLFLPSSLNETTYPNVSKAVDACKAWFKAIHPLVFALGSGGDDIFCHIFTIATYTNDCDLVVDHDEDLFLLTPHQIKAERTWTFVGPQATEWTPGLWTDMTKTIEDRGKERPSDEKNHALSPGVSATASPDACPYKKGDQVLASAFEIAARFEKWTHGLLDNIDWSTCVIAGGFVCELVHASDGNEEKDELRTDRLRSMDVDIWTSNAPVLCDYFVRKAKERQLHIAFAHTNHNIRVYFEGIPRTFQIVPYQTEQCKRWRSPNVIQPLDIVIRFDFTHLMWTYRNGQVRGTAAAFEALRTGISFINGYAPQIRQELPLEPFASIGTSPRLQTVSYLRLFKALNRGYSVAVYPHRRLHTLVGGFGSMAEFLLWHNSQGETEFLKNYRTLYCGVPTCASRSWGSLVFWQYLIAEAARVPVSSVTIDHAALSIGSTYDDLDGMGLEWSSSEYTAASTFLPPSLSRFSSTSSYMSTNAFYSEDASAATAGWGVIQDILRNPIAIIALRPRFTICTPPMKWKIDLQNPLQNPMTVSWHDSKTLWFEQWLEMVATQQQRYWEKHELELHRRDVSDYDPDSDMEEDSDDDEDEKKAKIHTAKEACKKKAIAAHKQTYGKAELKRVLNQSVFLSRVPRVSLAGFYSDKELLDNPSLGQLYEKFPEMQLVNVLHKIKMAKSNVLAIVKFDIDLSALQADQVAFARELYFVRTS